MPRAVLRRFWFSFDVDRAELPGGTALGCGVTAWTDDDAQHLVRERVFEGTDLPPFSVTPDVDVSSLDAGHVLPNMHPPERRGIWFPLGYE